MSFLLSKVNGIERRIGIANGTFFFMASTLMVKVIGALYKIPLFNLLGTDGIGLYQMVFPVYALLLTFSGGGVSTAMTRLVGEGYNGEDLLKKCLKIFAPLGLFFTFFLLIFANKIAFLQGNELASGLYRAISPSVFFVSLIACVRGYFQGKSNFTPTALSQVIEQLVKAVSGLIALLLVQGSILLKGIIACLAITLSELIALLFLLIKLKASKEKRKENIIKEEKLISYGYAFKFILPITLSSIVLPIASFLDSFIAINALKGIFYDKATSLYGIYTGGVDAVISLPVNLLHCLTLGFLPKISLNKKGVKVFWGVIVTAGLAGIAVIFTAPLVSNFLFKSGEFSSTLTALLRYSSISIILHSGLHAVNLLLLSVNKQKVSLINLLSGVICKIILSVSLIKIPKINVFGMLISDVGCYFVALILNLVYICYILKSKTAGKANENNVSGIGRRSKFTFRKSV